MFEFLVIVLTFLTYVASCLLSVLQGRWYRAITRMSAFVTLAVASFVTFHYRQDLKFHAASVCRPRRVSPEASLRRTSR
jgi:hypothetical protein